MKKRFLFFLSLSLVASIAIGLLWLTKEDSVKAQDNQQTPHPLAEINQKAKSVRNGNSADAEAYVAEILKVAGFEDELRGFTSTTIKDRVGRAEGRYRQGQTAGIPETKIVRTVNGLVRRFNLPEYTKTSLYEVRRLRMGLLPNFPQIVNQRNQGSQPVSVGAAIDSEMSPAESVFVLAMMLQQKLANPEFQLTHAERVNRWAETHNHRAGQNTSPHPAQNRSREVQAALQRAATSTSMSDALQLSNLTLNTLGIER